VIWCTRRTADDALYAIDQFVLRGGRLLAFVDPMPRPIPVGRGSRNPMAAMFADKSSDLDPCSHLGRAVRPPHRVVLDAALTAEVAWRPAAGRAIRRSCSSAWRCERAVARRRDQCVSWKPSTGLERLCSHAQGRDHFASSPWSAPAPVRPRCRPPSACDADARSVERCGWLQADRRALRGRRTRGRQVRRLSPPAQRRRRSSRGIEQAAQRGLVADTDLLATSSGCGSRISSASASRSAFANNGDFVVNALDNLQGSGALISVRARGASARPFETVEAIRRDAEARFRATEQQLQQRLNETERKLGELQQGKTAETAMILSPEQQAEIERFQKEKLEIRQELRGVRRQLDADIESLGTRLKLVNIGLVPLLLSLGALLWVFLRARARSQEGQQ
jgi:ABC-type uncharacterized transport system involved in gliding motility auxiliary subunit